MEINHILKVVLLLSCFFILSGCQNSKKVEDISTKELDKEISFWSSEDFAGRLTGTNGNQKVMEKLEKRFEEIGLESYEKDNYRSPFKLDYYDPSKLKARLKVKFHDGKEREFPYGKDWMERVIQNNTSIEAPISFKNSKNHIFVTADNHQAQDASAIFVKTKSFRKSLTFTDTHLPTIQISDHLYDYLENNQSSIKKVNIDYREPKKTITSYNIVGKIPGKKHDKAIVISAHFDHVGTWGKNTYRGSVDNATGVTGLLNLAAILKASSDQKEFDSDLIFAGFNGEESDRAGSKDFVKKLKKQYKSIINVNLDCIGIQKGGSIVFVGNENGSKKMGEGLQKIASKLDMKSKVEVGSTATLTSDHTSFLDEGFQAVNISQAKFDKIHTTDDNLNYTDSTPLKKAIEIVYNYILENHMKKFTKITYNENEKFELAMKENMEIKQTLKFGEYKTYRSNITDQTDIAYNLTKEISTNEVSAKLGKEDYEAKGYKLKTIAVTYVPDEALVFKKIEGATTKKPSKPSSFKKEDYNLIQVEFIFEKNKKNYSLDIYKTAPEMIDESDLSEIEKEKIADWIFYKADSSSYHWGERMISINNQKYKVSISDTSNYLPQNIPVKPYSKKEITDFIGNIQINSLITKSFDNNVFGK